jgi:uncharacterized protein YoxC
MMYSKALKHLNQIREELTDIIDGQSERLLDSTKSPQLQDDMQRNVIDLINETIEGIDNIVDSIDRDEYSDDEENEY